MNKCDLMKKGLARFMLTCFMAAVMVVPALAMEVPISSTAAEVNGQQILTEVYEVSPELDPQTLVKDDFTRDSFIYTFDQITKEENETTETKDVSQDVSVPVKNKKIEDNLGLLEQSIKYSDEEGFQGDLYLDPSSVTITADGYKSKSSKVSDTRTYTGLEYNDPTLIPSTVEKNGYTLSVSNIQWQEESMLEDGTIPATYTAVVSYSKTVYSNVATGYTMTAKYEGKVENTSKDKITYTVVYTGKEIEKEISTAAGSGFFGNMSGTQVALTSILSLAGLALLIGLLFLLLKKKGKKGGTAPMTAPTDLSDNDENS